MPTSAINRRLSARLLLLGVLCLFLPAGCAREQAPAEPALATLTGRAILPADSFAEGPSVGGALEPRINGRQTPFASVPVQGISSLITLGDDRFLALQDNGFGTRANSPGYPLRWYELLVPLDSANTTEGRIVLEGFTDLADPQSLLPFALSSEDSTRRLTGADLDPESFVSMPDGNFWVGEEFGPSLVNFSAQGTVLQKPVAIPIVPPLRPYARGSPHYRTPDHPDLRFLRREETADELANLPRSGGIEGLALNPGGSRLYVAVEKGLRDDPVANRRAILEFNPAQRSFTGNYWFYLTDEPDGSVASLEALDNRTMLVLERDGRDGKDAVIKRVYRVELGRVDPGGFLQKDLVCDLLNIDDTDGLTQRERSAVGLGRYFRFPFVTPESLLIVDENTIIVANDNNFPFDSGRRPPNTPDDSEVIRLKLHRPIGPTPPPPAD